MQLKSMWIHRHGLMLRRILLQHGLPGLMRRFFSEPGLLFMDNNRYGEWVRRYDSLTAEDSKKIRARIASLAYKPLISVIMPVYNTPSVFLREAIDSVRTQLYDK